MTPNELPQNVYVAVCLNKITGVSAVIFNGQVVVRYSTFKVAEETADDMNFSEKLGRYSKK